KKLESDIKNVTQRANQNGRHIRDIASKTDKIRGEYQQLDTLKKFKKAELDSLRSFYDGMIDRNEGDQARRYLTETIVPAERDYRQTSLKYDHKVRELAANELDKGLYAAIDVEVADAPPDGTQAAEAGFKAGDRMTVEEFRTLRTQVLKTLMGNEGPQE